MDPISGVAQTINEPTQQASQGKIILDGLKYSPKELVTAFLSAAISRKAENARPGTPLNKANLQQDRLKKEYPWLAEAILRENGEPKYFAINKWATPILISTGYPNDLNPFIDAAKTNDAHSVGGPKVQYADGSIVYCCVPSKNEKLESEIKKSVEKFSPSLSKATGLQLEYIAHEVETKQRIANLRIILEDGDKPIFSKGAQGVAFKNADKGWDENFPTVEDHSTSEFVGFQRDIRKKFLVGAVNFTPSQAYSTDGFFIPDNKNQITSAYCFISDKLAVNAFDAAIGECLIRSLGLPENATPFTIGNKESYNFLQLTLNPLGDYLPHRNIPTNYTQYDLHLLGLLYDPRIEPGMSFNQVINKISQ